MHNSILQEEKVLIDSFNICTCMSWPLLKGLELLQFIDVRNVKSKIFTISVFDTKKTDTHLAFDMFCKVFTARPSNKSKQMISLKNQLTGQHLPSKHQSDYEYIRNRVRQKLCKFCKHTPICFRKNIALCQACQHIREKSKLIY